MNFRRDGDNLLYFIKFKVDFMNFKKDELVQISPRAIGENYVTFYERGTQNYYDVTNDKVEIINEDTHPEYFL